jgi:transcriptional regulator with XRE-family HTH domain
MSLVDSKLSQIAVTIGANITAQRKAAGLTGLALAERLGIGSPNVSQWEHGTTLPTLARLLQIAAILDCPLAALLIGAEADSDAYRKGYADGWAACAEDVSAHLTRSPRQAVDD